MDELLNAQSLDSYLRKNNLPLLDRFGQNFLIDENVLTQIVTATQTEPTIPVIEVGAGLGVLTKAVAQKRKSDYFAVELDKRMILLLKERVTDLPFVKIIHGDILKKSPKDFSLSSPYDVIGNIPYNITSKLLRHILSWQPQPRSITFMMDNEVAKRITATPPDMSVLALSVQVFSDSKIVGPIISPTAFVPQPKVKSAVVRMEMRDKPLVQNELQREFFSLARGGFSQRRKTLQNSLRALWHCTGEESAKILKKAGIDPVRRAQTLTIAEWLNLLETKKHTL